jgi:hypothetical protein
MPAVSHRFGCEAAHTRFAIFPFTFGLNRQLQVDLLQREAILPVAQ